VDQQWVPAFAGTTPIFIASGGPKAHGNSPEQAKAGSAESLVLGLCGFSLVLSNPFFFVGFQLLPHRESTCLRHKDEEPQSPNTRDSALPAFRQNSPFWK